MQRLGDELSSWAVDARARLRNVGVTPRAEERGSVERIGDGVATISGLPGARQDEVLRLGERTLAMAVTLAADGIGAILLSAGEDVVAGEDVQGTGEVVQIPVGEALLGRVVDPLGRPLDGGPPAMTTERQPVERPAPSVVDRDLITQPLATGLLMIDAMLPVGRGQRELIIGDRKTGKSAIALDAIISQRGGDVACVYAAIGQQSATVKRVQELLSRHGALAHTILVVAPPDGPPGLSWIAPYAACTMAEYFRDRGRHALLVLDDLSKHAAIHRQLSLLLRRPPGREAYPGDIFYAHSRLLERGAKLAPRLGGGSLTILPIAETQEGNISAYIPTNLISITDGQVILEPKLFQEGLRPAVNVGLSVSRVGGKTQAAALMDVSRSLRLDYAQFLELEVFTRFGGMADEHMRRTVEHGRRIRALLSQPQCRPLTLTAEVAALLALSEGVLDGLPIEAVSPFRDRLDGWLADNAMDVVRRLAASGELTSEDRARLVSQMRLLRGRG